MKLRSLTALWRTNRHRLKLAAWQATGWEGFWWVAFMGAVLIGGCFASWHFWEALHGDVDSVSTTVRNIGLVIGGIVAVILAIWRSLVATRQANTAQQSLLNERFQNAAAMLGNENLSVRLGGIYALQALIEEHPQQYYVTCMRLLCAFVRNPPIDEHLTPLSDREMTRWGGGIRLRADVQAVMDMMRSRDAKLIELEDKQRFEVDFRGADLRGSNLWGVNLSRVDLRNADLSGAYAAGSNLSNAGLSGARLYKTILASANISGTNLWGADISRTWFCGKSLTPGRRFESPAVGMRFEKLWEACAMKSNPPVLGGVTLDARTGEPLVWNPSKGMGIEYVTK